MNFKKCIIYASALFVLLQAGCKEDEKSTEPATTPSLVYGRVTDLAYGNGINGASVIDLGPRAQASTVTDANGRFSISFGMLSSQYVTWLLVQASGYHDTTLNLTIEPGTDATISDIHMRPNETQVIITNPAVKKAAQVAYIGASASDIFISGVGALENSVVTYQVNDSLGLPVAKLPRYGATFTINFYPNIFVGGGTAPRAIPAFDSTDVNGRLRVSIVSGSQAGVIEVFSQVTVDSTKVINSQPVRITVHSGFPDRAHFTLMPSRFVFPSMDSYNEIPFTVAVGDTFSNPVPQGTAVYFHSQAGIMQTGNTFNAYTDKRGLASANLMTVNPRPLVIPFCDPPYLSGRVGGEWVYAQTLGRNNTKIVDSVLVIWNQAPILIGMESTAPSLNPQPDSLITMPAGGFSRVITMRITDWNSNPLCDGTRINVYMVYASDIAGLQYDISGNVPMTMPNAAYCRFPGYGTTDFNFRVTDNSEFLNPGTTITLVVDVVAPGVDAIRRSFPVQVY